MASFSAAILIVLIALPFGGSCAAAMFPTNARNAEAYLAGSIALAALVLVVAIYPQVVDGGVIQHRTPWIPELGLEFKGVRTALTPEKGRRLLRQSIAASRTGKYRRG